MIEDCHRGNARRGALLAPPAREYQTCRRPHVVGGRAGRRADRLPARKAAPSASQPSPSFPSPLPGARHALPSEDRIAPRNFEDHSPSPRTFIVAARRCPANRGYETIGSVSRPGIKRGFCRRKEVRCPPRSWTAMHVRHQSLLHESRGFEPGSLALIDVEVLRTLGRSERRISRSRRAPSEQTCDRSPHNPSNRCART
jgi:hypothetical protein